MAPDTHLVAFAELATTSHVSAATRAASLKLQKSRISCQFALKVINLFKYMGAQRCERVSLTRLRWPML